MRPSAAAFLPLTLTALSGVPADRAGTFETAARRTERLARDTWQTLLRADDRPHGTEFAVGLRRLSLAVGGFIGDDWSDESCSGHRDRIARYQWWLEEALADGDGAEFAEAFVRFDDALARAIASSDAGDGAGDGAGEPGGGGTGRAAAVTVHRSGTMAQWARQARAATSRATHRAASPLRWAPPWITSRHATSSSKWSRHSRSAG